MSHHEVPPGLQTLLEIAVGYDWPNGDEKQLREDAAAWRSAGAGLGPLLDGAARHARTAMDGLGGPTGTAFGAYWGRVDDAALPIEEFCAQLADSLDAAANQIETTRIEIISQLVYLALQLSWDAAVAVFNPAGAAAEAEAQILLTRATCLAVLRRAAAQIMTYEVKQGGLQVFFDFVAQSIELAQKHRGGLDGKELGIAAGNGVVGGAVGAGMGAALRGLGAQVGNALRNDIAEHLSYQDLSLSGKIAYHAAHVTGEAALGSVTGAAEAAAQDAAFSSGEVNPADVRTGAINGAGQGALGHGRGVLNPRGITPLSVIRNAFKNRGRTPPPPPPPTPPRIGLPDVGTSTGSFSADVFKDLPSHWFPDEGGT